MGVTASLIRYPAEVFAAVKAEGSYYPPNGKDIQQCHLSRSWYDIHAALRTFGPPLNLALSGDYGYAGGLDQFGWDEADKSDHYLGFMSPPLVKKIATRLSKLTFEQLAEKLAKPNRGTDYLKPPFLELVEFYNAATEAGNCVFIAVA